MLTIKVYFSFLSFSFLNMYWEPNMYKTLSLKDVKLYKWLTKQRVKDKSMKNMNCGLCQRVTTSLIGTIQKYEYMEITENGLGLVSHM